jgi:hypothetical protein
MDSDADRDAASAGAAASPDITALDDPNGANLLARAVTPKGDAARLAPVPTGAAGIYTLTIEPSDDASAWTGRIKRTVPRVAPTALRLNNGLDEVSYHGDGVGAVFAHHCTPCHEMADVVLRGPGIRACRTREDGGRQHAAGRRPLGSRERW